MIRGRMLRALAANRDPGFHFIGNFCEGAFHPQSVTMDVGRAVREQRFDVAQHVVECAEPECLARRAERERQCPVRIARRKPMLRHQARRGAGIVQPNGHVAMQGRAPVRRDAVRQSLPHQGVAEDQLLLAGPFVGVAHHQDAQHVVTRPRQGDPGRAVADGAALLQRLAHQLLATAAAVGGGNPLRPGRREDLAEGVLDDDGEAGELRLSRAKISVVAVLEASPPAMPTRVVP